MGVTTVVRRRIYAMRMQRDADFLTLAAQHSFTEDALAAFSPSISGEAYGRTWHLSRPVLTDDNRYLFGKLGFISDRGENAVRYDPETEDFQQVPGTGGLGAFSYYLLDLETQQLVFNESPPQIDRASFRVGLRSILKATYDDLHFEVDFIGDESEFQRWVGRAQTIAKIAISIRPPNPHWGDEVDDAIGILRDTNAARMKIEASAKREETLEVSALNGIANYALDGHGRVQASGEGEDGRIEFDSDHAVKGTAIDIDLAASQQSIIDRLLNVFRSIL